MYDESNSELILAAEDFSDDKFKEHHIFSSYEEKIIRKLIAHGPVLVRGGRGSGKSALLKEAFFRTKNEEYSKNILGIYISLRYLPLLRSEGKEYEEYFCRILSETIQREVDDDFSSTVDISDLQTALYDLSIKYQKRIILYFDDAAHIGRETSLKEFFDIFRMLSNKTVSCKAAIYPGVTEFGMRFDLLNDTNVIDITRNEEHVYFTEFFKELIAVRYANSIALKKLTIEKNDFAKFMGRAVAGNVRAFIFAMNYLGENTQGTITLPDIEDALKYLASEYYWPLLEELEPKLGKYEPLVVPAKEMAEILYDIVAESIDKPDYGPSCLIHRDNIARLKKIFEILEYAGFIVKRDSSRAMKSGGRGARYTLNLCNLLEIIPHSRLTNELFKKWLNHEKEYTQISKKSRLDNLELPILDDSRELGILEADIKILQKSNAYPYGLTDSKILILKDAGYKSVKDLFNADDKAILQLNSISHYWLERIRSVVGQAIWM